MPYRFILLAALIFPALAASPVRISGQDKAVPEQGLTIGGQISKPVTVTAETIAKLKRHTLKVQDHETPATYEGVALYDVLKDTGLPFGEKLRGKNLALVACVEAADGYQAVFSLTEFDPLFTDQIILLADTRDGKPLSAHEGKFRLIVPQEKRQARWVRQVTAIRILNAAEMK